VSEGIADGENSDNENGEIKDQAIHIEMNNY